MKPRLYLFLLAVSVYLLSCSKEPSPPLNPEEALSSFQLAPGLRLELVAAEPIVQDPIAIDFDEDGRLWVVEMRGFMPDIDGKDEERPVGRVSVLIDEDGDGTMDRSVVFIDSLVLPRALAVVKGGALIAENKPLWYAQDTDGDLRADVKTLIDPEYGGNGLIEHSPNGLWRGMDNWYYNAKSDFRYRLTNGQWIKEDTEFRGQWGICHDDAGRLHYNYNWSQLHADLVPPNYLSRNSHHQPTSGIDHGLTIDRTVFPIRSNRAINRGYVPGTLDEKGRIQEFASACSPFIYRGDALPREYLGNAFICEPTGNLLKRNIVLEDSFLLSAQAAYPDKEFLASTDERFRPVALASGPDGALYIADMYRGIIQHGPYMTPYLRKITLERKLDKPINMGRIWRIAPEGWKGTKSPELSKASSEQLLGLLSHANGWLRDMAQRLLVERRDTDNFLIPRLKTIVLSADEPLARLHALWTLEGLGNTDSEVYFSAINDPAPQVQAAAIRLLEPLAQKKPEMLAKLQAELSENWNQFAPPAITQTALTAGSFRTEAALPLLEKIISRFVSSELIRDAVMSSLQNREWAMLQRLQKNPQWQVYQTEKEIFFEMLASAVKNKGDALELSSVLAALYTGEDAMGWKEKAVLTGLAIPSKQKKSEQIALNVLPKVFSTQKRYEASVNARLQQLAAQFTWPGKIEKPIATAESRPLKEADPEVFALGRRQYLRVCAGCHGTDGAGLPRFAPPLVNSEWVLGDEKRLILITLHGMEGPLEVNGKLYKTPEILPVMPSLSVLDNRDLAAVMTYIRQEWGHTADPVKAGTVGHIRYRTQGKITPWTMEELASEEIYANLDALK